MSDTYCNEPWRTVHYDYDGKLGPCCTYRGERSNESSVKDYWNSEWLADFRRQLGEGVRHPGCKNCWQKEERGEISQRLEKNSKHGVVTEPDLQEIFISFGNICNKSCNICRPNRSSIIEKQYRLAGKDWNVDKDNLSTAWLENLEQYYQDISEKAETIHLNGGEPFIVKQCHDLLQYMADNNYTHKHIKANTNGSISPSQIELLNRFKKVSLHLSIDGILDLYPVVRPPHTWEWWLLHHDRIRQQNWKVTYATVVHVLNVHQLPLILDYYLSQYELYPDNTNIYFSTVNNQPNMSTHIAPKEVCVQSACLLEERLLKLPDEWKSNIENVIQHLYYSAENRNFKDDMEFKKFIETFGPIKGIDYAKHLPWNSWVFRNE